MFGASADALVELECVFTACTRKLHFCAKVAGEAETSWRARVLLGFPVDFMFIGSCVPSGGARRAVAVVQ